MDGLKPALRKLALDYWDDLILLIVLLVVSQGLISLLPPFERYVAERDPAYSYPFYEVETISSTELYVWCGLLSLLLVWITQGVVYRFQPNHELVRDILKPSFVLIETWGFSQLFTNVLKRYVGRPRPNFFAYCDYKGYRNALATGNFTSYDSVTVFGRLVPTSVCGDLLDPRFSFPSGHSSFSMASFLSLALFWYGIAELHQHHKLWKMFICSIPVLGAIVVAGSRTRDYYHGYDDVLCGSVIGAASALMCFTFNFNSRSRLGEKPSGQIAATHTPSSSSAAKAEMTASTAEA